MERVLKTPTETVPAWQFRLLERLKAMVDAEPDPQVKAELYGVANAMTAEPNAIEAGVGALALQDMVYVGVLPPPKGSDAAQLPQILFKSVQHGDDMDRSFTKFTVPMPIEALEMYVEYMRRYAGKEEEFRQYAEAV